MKLPALDMRLPLAICAGVLFLCGAFLIADSWRASATTPRDSVPRLRDYSEAALQRQIAGFDPAMAALARRFDPLGSGRPTSERLPQDAPATVESLAVDNLAPMTPAEAFRINAAAPVSTAPNPAARPFVLDTSDAAGARALDCLTAAVYYEAGYETPAGQAAVAQVVLNRMRHPAFPKSICGVVLQGAERHTGCQFTFACDGALSRSPNPQAWTRSRAVALAALNGRVEKTVGNATHYHTQWVHPYWADSLTKVRVIGAHVFYRWTGGWGLARSFREQYAGELDQYVGLRALYAALQPLGLKAPAAGQDGLILASGSALAATGQSIPASFTTSSPGAMNVPTVTAVDAPAASPPPPPKLFHISGEVAKPGDYVWREGMTLAEAAALAGGFTNRAGTKVVFLRRTGEPAEAKIEARKLALRPDDQVRVPVSYF